MKYLTNSGLSYFLNKMKTYISSAIPTKTSDLTNDSDFIDSNNLKTINNNSLVGNGNITITANSVDWDNVNNKPSTFTPSTHTHSASDITSGTLNTDRIPNLDASKITSGTIDIARLPAGALERLVTVADQTARFNLTTNDVQLGDTVKQLDTGIMYYVIDTSNLNSESGYTEYTAGSATSVPWSGVTGKPSSYTPSSHTHSASDITSGLATVATSGSYNDLSNKPTIPTVNNATLTIQKNGTTVKTFTANASSNVTANITVPTKVSELTNDSGYITSSGSCASCTTAGQVSTSVATGSSKDLVYAYMAGNDAFRISCGGDGNDGYVEIATSDDGNEPIYIRQYRWDGTVSGSFGSIVRTLTLLDESGNTQFPGTVTAPTFSGNLTGNCSGSAGSVAWDNVSGRPTIPTVNNATLTIQKNGTTVKTFTANASSNVTANITVPTKTSDLTNDSGFLTSHQDLSGYFSKEGGAITGTKITRSQNNDHIEITGGTDYNSGPSLVLTPYNSTEGWQPQGTFVLHTNAHNLIGYSNGTLTWDGQAIQTVSDQRLKQQIAEIDDKLLDAWEDVELSQFKYNDAVDQKKDKARLHTGYVVQQIDKACKSHGVDVSKYGLYCHEEYPEETEEVEVEQEDGTKTKERKVIREASEHYSLRYTEVYAVECAYLRRENSRLKENLASLEERLEKLEKVEK